jgi:hypothetical protein
MQIMQESHRVDGPDNVYRRHTLYIQFKDALRGEGGRGKGQGE